MLRQSHQRGHLARRHRAVAAIMDQRIGMGKNEPRQPEDVARWARRCMMHTSFSLAAERKQHEPSLMRSPPGQPGTGGQAGERSSEGFCVHGPRDGRRRRGRRGAAGTCAETSFSVMRSLVRGHSRMAEGSQVWRLWIDQIDAPMPRLREAEKLSQLEQG